MSKRVINSIKLGAFVIAGLVFLVILLYMIGKDKNLFGSNYVLKARFENTQGLVPGNNIRFSGIQCGTVKRVNILNDTVIEVTMVIETKMESIIRNNALVSIGTDGLVGNKIVNIVPARLPARLAVNGDMLATNKVVTTDDILQTLHKTTGEVSDIAENLKITVQNINNSKGLWSLLNDESIPKDVRLAIANVQLATRKAANITGELHQLVMDVKNGKGSFGAILKDSSIARNLNEALLKIGAVGAQTDSLASEISSFVANIRQEVDSGDGAANAILKDSGMVIKLNKSLDNIQKGTEGFNQNMEAMKHNFLFRKYYKNLEKQQQKEKDLKQSQKVNDTIH